MRYEEYLEKLKNAVEKKLGCPIEIKEIKKNNGYTYRGLGFNRQSAGFFTS